MIYIIEKLWTDTLENDYSRAQGYEPVGYVTQLDDARRIVHDAGVVTGDGWPFSKGQIVQAMRYRPLAQMRIP